jgi:UDP-N-acetylmuramoyl-tripeptide--D-alanyl-D-alanine ligase
MQVMVDREFSLFTLTEVGEILGSKTEGDPGFHRTSIRGVSTDSRTVRQSELFIAIKGEMHDGHDYLQQAFDKGAVAAVVNRSEVDSRSLVGPRYIVANDTIYALGELARCYRRKMPAKVIVVTGSNGKTTVKNLTYEILTSQEPAVKAQGNYNNLIGLPLSIFSLRLNHQAAVFELGMSARGEIARLSEIASAEIAVITNVGPVHLEFLRTIDEVANAKLEILGNIKPDGTLIVNGDDEILNRKLNGGDFRIIRFGLSTRNDIHPLRLQFDDFQMPRFEIGKSVINLALPGVHNVYNALAAFAAGMAADISAEKAAAAISAYRAEAMRSEVYRIGGVTLQIDCYNANPVSMKFALETLAHTHCEGRRIAVLADMLELGEAGPAYHEEIGDYARGQRIDRLFAYGPLSRSIVDRFGDGGAYFEDKKDLAVELIGSVKAGDVVLFKGSRGMALEEIVEKLKNKL